MRYLATRRAVAVAVLLAGSSIAAAEEAVPAVDTALDESEEQAIAIAALERMGSYLRSLDAFKVKAVTSTDEVLENGQKIQFDKSVELQAKKPAGMRADITSPFGKRSFYYDGKTFTLSTPDEKFYATIPASGTNGEFIEVVKDKTGANLPLADLFLWGTDDGSADAIEKAIVVGYGLVNGLQCEHYAFRQQQVDWQICIQQGDTPLPLKLVITSKLEEEQPQFVSVMQWDTAALPDDKVFTYAPQEGDIKISFNPVAKQSGAGN
jgi:hypothetical protein